MFNLVCFLALLLPPQIARADPADALAPISDGTGGPRALAGPLPTSTVPEAMATVNLSTGAARASYPFVLPRARGQAQPALFLEYDSSRGTGFAGEGWSLGLPSIVRKGASAQPAWDNPALGIFNKVFFDDFYIDGKLLVPICQVSGGSCVLGSPQAGEVFPGTIPGGFSQTSLDGWLYLRREIDDGNRYFLSPDSRTFVCQTKAGTILQFGHPLDAKTADGLEIPRDTPTDPSGAPYRWNLVRNIDASGNAVWFVWDTLQSKLPSGASNPGIQYLTDIYDTPSDTVIFQFFAHHVRLTWELSDPEGPSALDAPVWHAPPFARLKTVDVTSSTMGSIVSSVPRQLVRRYDLEYSRNIANTHS